MVTLSRANRRPASLPHKQLAMVTRPVCSFTVDLRFGVKADGSSLCLGAWLATGMGNSDLNAYTV